MKRAWEIAREGVKKFGGKAIEYISESLKMAWAEFKSETVEVVNHCMETVNELVKFMNTDSNNFDRQANLWTKPANFMRIYFNLNGWKGWLQIDKSTYLITDHKYEVYSKHITTDKLERIINEYNTNGVVTA